MIRPSIYLDWAAAAPPNRQALRVWRTMSSHHFANPSSLHGPGQAANEALQGWQNQLAQTLAVKSHQLHLTAGATAANQMVLAWAKSRGLKLACLATDHDSIRSAADYQLPVQTTTGTLDWPRLQLAADIGVISLAGINNETGITQPWSAVRAARSRLRRARRAQGIKQPLWVHVDGSQMITTTNCQPQSLGVDLLTINGAKCGAPKRIGCLFAAQVAGPAPSERDFSWTDPATAGTESIANLAALAVAVAQAQTRVTKLARQLNHLQAGFELRLRALGGQVIGADCLRSPHITNCYFRGVDNERLALALSQRGVSVGVGSACQAGRGEPSSTLMALGLTAEQARGSLRFSFGWSTTARDLQRAVKVLGVILATSNGGGST